MQLSWPTETAHDPQLVSHAWRHPGSNICLDFHGDPTNSELCVFSDGNHHMALQAGLDEFRVREGLDSIFYCTTPPGVYLDWLRAGAIEIGNLTLRLKPDLVIGPEELISRQTTSMGIESCKVFAKSQGNHLIVRKGNPKNLQGITDLFRPDVRLFISNPTTEKASHEVYRSTIERFALAEKMPPATVDALFADPEKIMFGELIHHREAPQALADGAADVAIVYAHLALRYTRIFPDLIETVTLPAGASNLTTEYAVGITNTGNPLASKLFEFFSVDRLTALYRHHGLIAPT